MGIQEFLTNSQKYPCTFQLFIDATKTTNFGSKQHNLFLECTSCDDSSSWGEMKGTNMYI